MKVKVFIISILYFLSLKLLAQNNADSTLWEAVPIATIDCRLHKGEQSVYYYRLAEGDTLYVQYQRKQGEALALLDLSAYRSNSIFQKHDNEQLNEKIWIPTDGIYALTLANASTKEHTGKIQILRRPAYEETVQLNVNVPLKTVYDTSYIYEKKKIIIRQDTTAEEVINRTFMISSMANLRQASRTAVEIKLPKDASYWVYHLSVSEETNIQLEKLAKELSKGASTLLAANPLAAFGVGLIGTLPSVAVGEDIDYYIGQKADIELFEKGQPFKYYKKAMRIVSDYARIRANEIPHDGSLYFGFYNDNFVEGIKATLRVAAIKIKPITELKTTRKPQLAKRFIPAE